jgi:hypothetical protein
LGHGVLGQLAGHGVGAQDAGVNVQEFHDKSFQWVCCVNGLIVAMRLMFDKSAILR